MKNPSILNRTILGLEIALGCLVTVWVLGLSPAFASTAIPPTQNQSVPLALVESPTMVPTAKATTTPTTIRTATARPTSTRTPNPATRTSPTVPRTATPTRTAVSQPTRPATGASPTPSKPSQVSTHRSGDQFTLLVDGKPKYISGMNYNVNYTQLPEEIRRKLHRRDFQIMRDAGVNAIVGWGIYDEITLQVAEEYGIGVIMPFDLDPKGAYENLDYRNQIKTDYIDYIKRFRAFRAIWGWNPGGDELLYRMDTEEHRTVDKLQMAADLELELVVISQSLDPSHINLIKEPRDWYIKYLGASLQQLKRQPMYHGLGSNLIYGVNVYGRYEDIELALTNAKLTLTDQLGLAMLVTEFAPFDSPVIDRPANYIRIWDLITRLSDLGGLVYVFGPDQPNPQVANPYDPLTLLPNEYSLVDIHGTPLDHSLAALAAKWRVP